MASQSNPAPSGPVVEPAQVWPTLATEIQTRIIRLLAGLASNLAVAQAQLQTLQNEKEVTNARTSH